MGESLEQKIVRSGGAARMLRANTLRPRFPFQDEYTSWRDEQWAWANTAVMFDQGHHMWEVWISGPDVYRLLSDFGVNSFATFGPGKAKQYIAVREDGYYVGDGILFGMPDNTVILAGPPNASDWLAFQAHTGGYDVEFSADLPDYLNTTGRKLYRYQLQGPMAQRIVEKATGGTMDRIKFFNIGHFTVNNCVVQGLNHTMSGVPGEEMTGLEMFGPLKDGPAVLDGLLTAGEEFGLRQGGSLAYQTTALESGWMGLPVPALYSGENTRAFREWQPAASFQGWATLGGSIDTDEIEDVYSTPWSLGYGRMVKFDHDFLGRSALKAADPAAQRNKVWLRWNDEDTAAVMSRGFFGPPEQRTKYLKLPHAVYAMFQCDQVLLDDRLVGRSDKTGYTVNVGGWSSLASVDADVAVDGTEVSVVWGESSGGAGQDPVERHVQARIRATVSTRPLVG